MTSPPGKLALPPLRTNPDGDPRRIGVELEMNGIDLDTLAQAAARFLGTTVTEDGRYQRVLRGDPAGDWIVEFDFQLLKTMGREERNDGELVADLMSSAEELLRTVSEPLVPLELVSPPLPMTRLDEVEHLIAVLRDIGARGTSDRISNAFGMQLNPEIPGRDADVLSAYVRAFLCLYPWIYQRADINITRRLTTYVDPFPIDYVRKVVTVDYAPDLPGLIDDYLEFNPTRNRALDMLPLFLYIDEKRVRAVTDDPLIKPRPAFHYRLPDCEIHRPDWGLHVAWNDWLEVERLAVDGERLRACCAAYRVFLDRSLERWFGDWHAQVEATWLDR